MKDKPRSPLQGPARHLQFTHPSRQKIWENPVRHLTRNPLLTPSPAESDPAGAPLERATRQPKLRPGH